MPQLKFNNGLSVNKTEPSRKLYLSQHSSSSISSACTSSGHSICPTPAGDDDVWMLMSSDLTPDIEDFTISLIENNTGTVASHSQHLGNNV